MGRIPTSLLVAAMGAVLAFGSPAHAQRFLLDLGPTTLPGGPATTPSPDANGNIWNNFSPGQFVRLVDTTGATPGATHPDGIGLGATTPVGASLAPDEGLLDPDPALLAGLAVESATQDYLFRYGPGGEIIELELSGVDPGASMDFRFFASRSAGQAGAITRYEVTGDNGSQGVTLATSDNAGETAEVSGVRALANGTIRVTVSAEHGAFMYLNALEIEIGTAPQITFTSQPEGAIVDAGRTMVFAAGVEASEPGVSLRWRRDGEPLADGGRISGATADTLIIEGVRPTDAGEYTLDASLAGVTETSDPAVGAVRGTPGGLADFNGDGVLDFFDVLAFLTDLAAASP